MLVDINVSAVALVFSFLDPKGGSQNAKKVKRLKEHIALHETRPNTELRGVTCHMGSHSVTCHPTQVNAPRLNPSQQAGTRFTYPGGMEV